MAREFHPVADIFPLLPEDALAGLAADIKANGLREAIWTDAEGRIIDGRNRYLACQRVGVEPRFRQWDGSGSLVAFVVSLNLHRRHLNESQRAMVAAKIANLQRGNVAAQKAGLPIGTSAVSVGDAAKLLNVGTHSVHRAKTVLREGTAEEIEAVNRGEAAVGTLAREIAKNLPPDRRAVKRNGSLATAGKNPERIENQRIRAQIWGAVRDGLTALSGLPSPAEVVAIARAHDKTGLVDAKAVAALNWLKEFCDEWRHRDAA